MFLLNTPPLAAFQKQWTPFGCTAPCRVPTSLPQPSQVANISTAADVEGAIDCAQSDKSSLTVSLDYERIMQWNRKGDPYIVRGQKSSSALYKGPAREKAALDVPVQFKDVKEEECSDFRTLALDSDSDDSVDRGIEEAIQEYLKNKDRADPLSCTSANKSPSLKENDGDQVKAFPITALVKKSPVKMVTSPKVYNSFTVESQSRCSSPDSVGSDDSFEQSINKEIEQFLIEKKLQNNASESCTIKKAAAKPKAMRAVEKLGPKQGIKGPTMKTASESLHLLSIGYKSKAESCKNNVHLKPVSGPAKSNVLRRQPLPLAQCTELSDSSSDDGIEEAIQLFQLEKSRLEGSLSSTSRTCLEKDGKSTSPMSDVSQMMKPPEFKVKTDYRKRKLSSVKPATSQDFTSKRTFHSGDDWSHEHKPELAATRRVETAAELMCAEAILDISKAILPSQPESHFTSLQDKLSAQPASPCPSDSSVDSDDSIEQEIRTFLARKAEAESHSPTSAKLSSNEQRSEPPKRPSLSNANAAGTSKSKVNDNKVVFKDSIEKGVESLNVDSSPVHSALPFSPHLTGKTAESCLDSSKLHHQAEDGKRHVIQAMKNLEASPRVSGGKRKLYMKISNYNGDKSSSLDSDEDLDSAIKDLLRSKRKCKKRPKDGRPQCKKKVRFGETITRPLETEGDTEQDWKSKPILVKNGPVISNDPKEHYVKKLKTKLKEDKKASAGNSELSTVSKAIECKPACASDKSVKISSAFPDTQDSSSVDSDDSIEQEIRKFLAERARESTEPSIPQRTTAAVITPTITKTETTAACTVSPAPMKKELGCTVGPAPVRKDPIVCTVSPASVRKEPSYTVGPAPVRKEPSYTVGPAPMRIEPVYTVGPVPVRKEPSCTVRPAPARKEPGCTLSPAPVRKEPGVLSSSVTETILQKVREKDRSTAPAAQPAVIKHLYGYKDSFSPLARLQHPAGIAKATAPVHSVIVKRDCIVEQNRMARPTETTLPTAPDRVVVQTNGSQGNIPISGNFVAGLKYISGTEQQLLLNVGKTGTSRLATDYYNPGGTITQLGSCQAVPKKLILEQPKVIQTPTFSLGAPMVRPALYVVTTKVVQETSASLCLPINAATYDTGLNLMSIQYCPSQVASHTSACAAPFSFQQTRNNETMVITPGRAGEIPAFITKARPSKAMRAPLDGESKCANVIEIAAEDIEAGARKAQKDKVNSIDPGWTVPLYIALSPKDICNRSHLHRRADGILSQVRKRKVYTRIRPHPAAGKPR